MKEDLLEYMSLRSQKLGSAKSNGGPVITISREKGCPGNTVARLLAIKLSKEKGLGEWRFVNKDIIEESARELHVNPSKINHAIYSEDKGFFRDLMLSFGERYYESDVKIKKTLAELILQSAIKGNVIIVGIGGAAITKNIEKSIHIKLTGPYKYRLQIVEKEEGLNAEDARDYMDETDLNRKMLVDYYNGIKAGNDLFHAQFNCSLLTANEIVDSIINLVKGKKFI